MLVLYLDFGKTMMVSVYKGLEDLGHTILGGRDMQVTLSRLARIHYHMAHSNGDLCVPSVPTEGRQSHMISKHANIAMPLIRIPRKDVKYSKFRIYLSLAY